MDTHERDLWNDIERFTLDERNAALPVSRLAAAAVVATLVLSGCEGEAMAHFVPLLAYSFVALVAWLLRSPSRGRRGGAGSVSGSCGTGADSDGADAGDGGDGGCGGGCGGD